MSKIQFTINGKVASKEEFELVKKYIANNADYKKTDAMGDNNFTRQEIISFFDATGDGKLTRKDIATPGFRLGGFHDVKKILAKYGIEFEGSLRSKLDPAKISDPQDSLLDLIDNVDYLFVGDVHLVDEEAHFNGMMNTLHKHGIKYLAVEFASDQQDAMKFFLKEGDSSKFTPPFDEVIKFEPGLIKLIQTAHKAGIKVICIDQPYQKQKSKIKREQFIADQLIPLQKKGKVLVWIGSAHAAIDRKPYTSVRALLDDAGIKTAGVKLESREAIETELSFKNKKAAQLHTAFSVYFGADSPRKSNCLPHIRTGRSWLF